MSILLEITAVAILTHDEIDFKAKDITRYLESHLIERKIGYNNPKCL